jgi:hypothetical protein
MKYITILLIMFSAAFTFNVTGEAETIDFQKFQLMPSDDSASDKDFSQFISKFKKDVKNKNIEALKKSIAPDISYTFGDEDGIKGFLKIWKLDKNPKNSEFWGEMDKILSMGSAYYNEEKTSHAYPYLFVTFPPDYDSYEYAAVTGRKVNVRKVPSSKSPVVKTLDYEIVKPINVESDPKKEKIDGYTGIWVNVMTAGGNTGYIFSRYLHSPIGYRAIFEKQAKGWMLTAFISGD